MGGTMSAPFMFTTAEEDFKFTSFSANHILNHGPIPANERYVGPTGATGGEKYNYGLYLVGDANVENGNASYACCDVYVSDQSCATGKLYSAISQVNANPEYVNDESNYEVEHNAGGGKIFV